MYLFGRSAVLGNGNSRDGALWVGSITEKVNQITDLNVTVWRTVFSAEIGTITWVSVVEELSQLEAADDKLAADDGFVALLDQGAAYTIGSVNDTLGEVVFAPEGGERPMEYASTVTALMAQGNFAKGVEVGIEIAQRVSKITGEPTTFVKGITGDYSAVEWITSYESVQAMQDANNKLNQDASFVQFIDKEIVGVYEAGPSVTKQTLYRKVL